MYVGPDDIPFYIGKGKGYRYGIQHHLGRDNHNNQLLKNKIRKVGADNITIHFLHENLTEEKAFYWERYWIKYIGRRDLGEGTLCNLTDGGEGTSGYVCSKETKLKIGKANKGHKVSAETKLKIGKANKGHKVSADAKLKIGEAQKERKREQHSEKTKQKISKANKGKPSNRKGKKHTEKTKQKMREAAKRRTKKTQENTTTQIEENS